MKKDLVAAMLLILICSFLVTCFTENLPEKYCLFDFVEAVKTCVRRNFDSFVTMKGQKVHTSSACCKVVKEFSEACASKNIIFESEMFFFRWVMDSCGTDHQPSTPPSSPPTPPCGSSPPSNSSTPPTTPAPSISSHFEPPPLKLPQVTVSSGACGSGAAYAIDCWFGLFNNGSSVCCSLKRSKGIHCETGEHFDTVQEKCCVDNIHADHSQMTSLPWFQVNPRYLGSLD